MSTSLRERRLILERILVKATPLLLEGYSSHPGSDPARNSRLLTQTKKSPQDLVTLYDQKVEEFLLRELEQHFPGEVFVGEESASKDSSLTLKALQEKGITSCWVMDPIDGTTNYSRAYPFFCTTAAWLEISPETGCFDTRVGAIWEPLRQELFSAERGGGAWMNQQRLQVSTTTEPLSALLSTGFAALRQNPSQTPFHLFEKLTQATLGVRRAGSAALDLASVAIGRLDGYWEKGLSPWDVAAGVLLIEEAGGKVTHLDGAPRKIETGEILSSNGFLHKWLQSTLNEQ